MFHHFNLDELGDAENNLKGQKWLKFAKFRNAKIFGKCQIQKMSIIFVKYLKQLKFAKFRNANNIWKMPKIVQTC